MHALDPTSIPQNVILTFCSTPAGPVMQALED